MMPSRGLAPLSASTRLFLKPGRVGLRSISTASSRPSIRPLLPPRSSQWQGAAARRHLSWWPLSSSSSSQGAVPASAPSQSPTSNETVTSAASSVQSSPTPVAAAQEPATAATATATDFSSIDLDAIQQAAVPITALPEQIGYLKAVGLDYGWGPTSMLQWSLEHVHIYTGLPWWASIMITALSVRIIFLPMLLRSADMTARQQALQPVLKPITTQMTEAYRARDSQKVMELRKEMQQIYVQGNIKMSQIFTPIIFQGIFAYCALKLMRGMSALPVPGFLDGGILWFTDLTARDPYFALPIVMAGSMHLLVRYGGEGGAMNTQTPGMKNFLMYGMPMIIVVTMAYFPAAVNLWLSATGIFAIAQAKTLQNNDIRKRLGLTPLYKAPPAAPAPAKPSKVSPSVVPNRTIDVSATSSRSMPASSYNYQAPNIKHTVREAAGKRKTEPIVEEKSSSPKDWAAKKVNAVGEGWQETKNDLSTRFKTYVEGMQKQGSKTKSKEFMARAKAYEERAQARQHQR